MRGFIGYLPERFEEDIEGFQSVDRTTGGLTFNHRPTEWFTHRVVGGPTSPTSEHPPLGGHASRGNNNGPGGGTWGTPDCYASLDYGANVPLQLTSCV
jgi:hypothetical protein